MPDGTCRTIKANQAKVSAANLATQTARGATGVFVDLSYKQFNVTDIARCLKARYTAAPTNHACEDSGVICMSIRGQKLQKQIDVSQTLDSSCRNNLSQKQTCCAVLTVNREEKHQNGRRIKDEGEPMFTLTAQDRHGVAIAYDEQGRANKKLTPSDICPTLRAQSHGNEPKVIDAIYNSREPRVSDTCPTLRSERTGLLVKGGVRIRRMTPREC